MIGILHGRLVINAINSLVSNDKTFNYADRHYDISKVVADGERAAAVTTSVGIKGVKALLMLIVIVGLLIPNRVFNKRALTRMALLTTSCRLF